MKSNRTIKTKKPTITKKLKIKEEDICQQLADFAETTDTITKD